VFERGDGVGLEITPTVIRGVRLDSDVPGRAAGVAEVPIGSFDDHEAIFDALVRVRGQLDAEGLPTRIGWFPAGASLQRLDVTGRSGPELNIVRHDLSQRFGVTSSMLVDADARRWMLVLIWDHVTAWRLEELAERAGFVDAAVEPAPVSVQRVLGAGVSVARRDASSGRSWAAIYQGNAPLAAATVDAANREYPGLAVADVAIGLHRLDEPLPVADLSDEVSRLAAAAFSNGERSKGERSGGPDAGLQVLGEPYPPFPAHDLRAQQRVAVALGAAIGAAGLAGRLRPVDVTATRVDGDAVERPWAVERITDVSSGVDRPQVPRWHRRWRRFAQR
jgi:hypothetical protein